MRRKKKKSGPVGGREELCEVLYKRAMGFVCEETVDEYAVSGGGEELKLVKRKITAKYNPPDLAAIKALLEFDGDGLNNLTDEELEKEKQRLIERLKKELEQ